MNGRDPVAVSRGICFPHLPQKTAVRFTLAPQCGQGSSAVVATTATADGGMSAGASGGIAAGISIGAGSAGRIGAAGNGMASDGSGEPSAVCKCNKFSEVALKSPPHLGQNLASGLQANWHTRHVFVVIKGRLCDAKGLPHLAQKLAPALFWKLHIEQITRSLSSCKSTVNNTQIMSSDC